MMDTQADMGLRCFHMPPKLFSYGEALINTFDQGQPANVLVISVISFCHSVKYRANSKTDVDPERMHSWSGPFCHIESILFIPTLDTTTKIVIMIH